MDDVSRIHIPKNMVPFAENLDQVVLPSPSRGETVLDRCVDTNTSVQYCAELQVLAAQLQHDGSAGPAGQDQEDLHLPQHHRGRAQVGTVDRDRDRDRVDGVLQQNIFRTDYYSRILFPAAFIALNCVYWCVVLI